MLMYFKKHVYNKNAAVFAHIQIMVLITLFNILQDGCRVLFL